jgi:hypothetical protein
MFRSKSMGIFRLSPNCHSSFFVFIKFTSTCILYIYEIYIVRVVRKFFSAQGFIAKSDIEELKE